MLQPSCYLLALIFLSFSVPSLTIQCYSGSQLQILECPSISCIKQTLGLDTVRYCDGTGVSSICQTYRIFDSCQNIPNLGYICCCSEQLCNSATKQGLTAVFSSIGLVFLVRHLL
uniref:UPAR/Ly6 domain-containing protein n=1 Tax=Panagrolaimus sp. JU765 TaxID=591449 RepID=A0AC34QFD1_9BILA